MTESVYSYESDNAAQFVKNVHGSDKQHIALYIGFGGLTPCMDVVDAVLAPMSGTERKILDIGCGTGIWAVEMAKRYKHATVIGVDLVPPPLDESEFPDNLTFEIDDVNYGLAHFYNQFDVVHVRCVGAGIRDFKKLMEDAEKCLKPGGLVIFIGGDRTLLAEDRLHGVKFPVDDSDMTGSWTRKLLWEAWEASGIAGSDLELEPLLLDRGLWDHSILDPKTAVSGGVCLPLGPWKRDLDPTRSAQLQYAGALMRQVFLNIHRAFHGILLKSGMEKKTLDQWAQKIDTELTELTIKTWVRFRFSWARRRDGPNRSAPSLPNTSIPSGVQPKEGNTGAEVEGAGEYAESYQRDPKFRYPYIDFYHSAEEAIAQMQRRKECQGELAETEVRNAWARMKAQE